VKRAGIYLEPSWAGEVGGAQNVAAVLAERLQESYETELLVVRPDFCIKTLAAVSNTSIDEVKLRYTPSGGAEARIGVAEGYDVFVAIVHDIPPIAPAPVGILFVLFPFRAKNTRWPWNISNGGSPSLRQKLNRMHEEYRWRKRFSSYQIRTSNSKYTQKWTQLRWGIDTEVLYPPIDSTRESMTRRPRILSVGRFSQLGVSKGQLELMRAFRHLQQMSPAAEDWSYSSVGALWPQDEDCLFFEKCRAMAFDTGTQLDTNLSAKDLRQAYASSSLFWHWAGFNNNESVTPQRSEHFGMVTAEAMAQGAVPLVARRGGQPEIVQHGVNGFLWDSLEELQHLSAQIIAQPEELRQMSCCAAESVREFSRSQFRARFDSYLADACS